MKITIEPTNKQPENIEDAYPQVSIALEGDYHNLQVVVDCLVVPALRAFGYLIPEGCIKVLPHNL